jgi:hypothetical protein
MLLTTQIFACSTSSQPESTDTAAFPQTSSPQIITIDSFINNRSVNVVSDPCGDVVETAKSAAGADLATTYALMDADYLFAAMQLCDTFDTSVTRYYFVDLDMNGDKLPDYSIGVVPYNIAGKEAGKAWILTYGGTNAADWHVINNSEATEVITSSTIKSGLLKMAIPRTAYDIPDFVTITFRVSEGNINLDLTGSFMVASV